MTRRGADILVANLACCALSATNPGIHGNMTPRFYGRIRSGAFDPAGNFVAERERKRTPRANIELFFSTERKIAVLHMQVGGANPATFDSDQYFGALRRRQVGHRFAERRSVGRQGLSVHFHACDFTFGLLLAGKKHLPMQQNLRPECLRLATSDRWRLRPGARLGPRPRFSGSAAAFFGAARRRPRSLAGAKARRRLAAPVAG